MSIFRGFIVVLSLYLLIASILPIFGWQLFIYGPFKLDAFDPIVGNALFLVITKSASFMTLSFFAFNYLQNRKPLSSVAPLLVYSNFTIIFGVIFLIQSDNTQWSHWTLVFLLSVISVILFQENRKEAKKIFRDDWWKAGNNSLRKVLSSDRRIMLLELRKLVPKAGIKLAFIWISYIKFSSLPTISPTVKSIQIEYSINFYHSIF